MYRFSSFLSGWKAVVLGSLFVYCLLLPNWVSSFALFKGGVAPQMEKSLAGVSEKWRHFGAVDPDGAKWLSLLNQGISEKSWLLSSSSIDAVTLSGESVPVFWPSGYFWYLRVLQKAFSLGGLSFDDSILAAGYFSGPLLLLFSIPLVVFFALRVFPNPYGFFFLPLLLVVPSTEAIFSCFLPDHHGLIFMVTLLWLLTFFWRSDGAWLVSGFFLGLNFWLSTLTIVPLLGLFGFCALAAGFFGYPFCSSVFWRKWTRVSAGVATFFWLVDIVPGRLGMRLEVVHPLWILAILGGGELLFRCSVFCEGKKQPGFLSSGPFLGWAISLLFVIAPVFSIIYSSGAWFYPSYPWVKQLMYAIAELQPVDLGRVIFGMAFTPIFLAVAVGLEWRKSTAWGVALLGVFVLALPLFQSRWMPFASLFSCFGMVYWLSHSFYGDSSIFRRVTGGILFFAVFFTFVANTSQHVGQIQTGKAPVTDSSSPFSSTVWAADLAAFLIKDHGGKDFVVLGQPTVGTWVAYYGGARTVGSMYWEAWRGLKDSTEFFGSDIESNSRLIVDKYGVDYILVQPTFASRFNQPAGGPALGPTMGDRILSGKDLPKWLKLVPWAAGSKLDLKVYKVVPEEANIPGEAAPKSSEEEKPKAPEEGA